MAGWETNDQGCEVALLLEPSDIDGMHFCILSGVAESIQQTVRFWDGVE